MIEENNKQKKAVPVQEQPQPTAVPPASTSTVQAPTAQPQPGAGADMAQPASGVAQQAQTGTRMSTLDRIIKPRLADNTAVKFEQPLARPAEIAGKQEMDNAKPYRTKDGFTYKANTGKLYDDQGRELSPFAYAVELADKNRMTPEEKAAEAKRERRTKIFSAIGDGIAALANVYFTSKGAPDMYNPSTSMSAKTKAYWDKLNAERKANEDKYNDLLLGAYKADNADRDAKDKWQQQLEQWKIEMERKMKLRRISVVRMRLMPSTERKRMTPTGPHGKRLPQARSKRPTGVLRPTGLRDRPSSTSGMEARAVATRASTHSRWDAAKAQSRSIPMLSMMPMYGRSMTGSLRR